MNKYGEIMDRIRADEKMHSRVMSAVRMRRKKRAPLYIRIMPFAACFAVALAAAIIVPRVIGGDIEVSSDYGSSIDDSVTMYSPKECRSAEELSGSIGFAFSDPQTLPFEVESAQYYDLFGEVAEAVYSGCGQSAAYRMSIGSDDNSGDNNIYTDVVTEDIGGKSVVLKGEDGKYTLAVWTDGGFSYSLSLSEGLTDEQWRGIIA